MYLFVTSITVNNCKYVHDFCNYEYKQELSPILANLKNSQYSPTQITRLNDDVAFLIENIEDFDDNDPMDNQHMHVVQEGEAEQRLARKKCEGTVKTTIAGPTVDGRLKGNQKVTCYKKALRYREKGKERQ